MKNIVFGIIAVVGGLSGHLALRGTGSSTALVVVGAILVVVGAVQEKQRRA